MRLDEVPQPSTQWAADLASASMALARLTARGATLWCWAPQWPQHAEHLAVEFVHPVIVGTRALPAEAIAGPDPLSALRAVVEPGDVVVAIAAADAPGTVEVLRHAPAWGATTLWIGYGPRPAGVPADHVVWLDDAGTHDAAFDGRLVLTYHVLWELTHVCYEHPGLLDDDRRPPDDVPTGTAPSGDAEPGSHCITCADEGRVAEVVDVETAPDVVVRSGGSLEHADASLIDPVSPGDLVLVHAGVAISMLEMVATKGTDR